MIALAAGEHEVRPYAGDWYVQGIGVRGNTLQISVAANLSGLADLTGFGQQRHANRTWLPDSTDLSPIGTGLG